MNVLEVVPAHPVYVLHKRRYKESAAILEVLSREHGRTAVVAHGVGSSRRRAGAVTAEAFSLLQLGWRRRGELGSATSIEAIGSSLAMPRERLALGFYANELLLRLVPRDDPCPDLAAAYWGLVESLSQVSTDAEMVLRQFEKRLLEALGYGLNLRACADGGRITPDCRYRYISGAGGFAQAGGQAGSVSGATLLALAAEETLDPVQKREAKHLLRAALEPLLGDKPLRSRAAFRA